MSRVISVRDIQEMIRSGQGVSIPDDALVTPSARDYLFELETSGGATGVNGAQANGTKTNLPFVAGEHLSPPAQKLNSKSPRRELGAFFNSPYANSLKDQICEMGRRLWKRAYVDGNGGNMAIRVGDDIAICTPTLVSKGSLQAGGHVPRGFRGQPTCSAPRSAPAKS